MRDINVGKGEDWNFLGFFDDTMEKGYRVGRYGRVLGDIDTLNAWPTTIAVAIAMGNPDNLRSVRERISNDKVYFPNLISPDFRIMDDSCFNVGEGNIINFNGIASVETSIGDFNVLMDNVTIGHNAVLGNYNVIMPKASICGNVTIGSQNLIGLGAIVLQKLSVGDGVRLGAGAVAMASLKDGLTYVGNPARPVFKR